MVRELVPSVQSMSNGRPHLQQWGVLMSHLSEVDVRLLSQTSNIARPNATTPLGTMYELFQNAEGGSSDIHITLSARTGTGLMHNTSL